jgi:ketosteroid isomerase-like protein
LKRNVNEEKALSSPFSEKKPTTDEVQIRAVIDGVNKAIFAKDAGSVIRHYSPDAAIFDLAPPLVSAIGTDAVKFQAWLDTLDGPVEREIRDLTISVSGDQAICYGFLRLGGQKGGEYRSFWARATVVLQRNAPSWRIVHEHVSVPFSMDADPRPAFNLQP